MEGVPYGGITRLAPTPSGYLHAGNAINFLITARLAQESGSRVLLRIDDLDQERVRPEYVEDVFRSLEWLGIHWDDGPSGPEELYSTWSQQLRTARYLTLADELRVLGLCYGCTCSRSLLRSMAPDGRYPGTCRHRKLDLDAPDTAWRLDLGDPATVQVPELWGRIRSVSGAEMSGDPVIRQRNGRPAYQLASLADDEDHRITFIVRGADLIPSTACQLLLAQHLGLSGFRQVRFLHHPLVVDHGGDKLSKSAGAASLKAMREAGATAEGLRSQAARMLDMLRGDGR
jgi:glutamyl/glutaminyl-tRNA synthetase